MKDEGMLSSYAIDCKTYVGLKQLIAFYYITMCKDMLAGDSHSFKTAK